MSITREGVGEMGGVRRGEEWKGCKYSTHVWNSQN